MQDVEEKKYYVPNNYKVKGKYKGFYIRNLVEAAILGVGVGFVLYKALPFIKMANLAIAGTYAIGMCVFCIIGVGDRSLCEFIVAWLRYVMTRKLYTFKPLENVMKESKTVSVSGGGVRESNLSRILNTVKGKLGGDK